MRCAEPGSRRSPRRRNLALVVYYDYLDRRRSAVLLADDGPVQRVPGRSARQLPGNVLSSATTTPARRTS
ncbi:hypothetical protein HBB16_09505 [Pseudonocardia sp. MCCB 268]|nr:hypothetical protein [Pseudonocardia cytotoxica]